jgi:hypothetical protein
MGIAAANTAVITGKPVFNPDEEWYKRKLRKWGKE